VKKLLAVLAYTAIIIAAWRWSDSTLTFIVAGLGVVVLLDRYAFRLLPWTGTPRWRSELLLAGVYFSVGGVGFFLMRPGIVPAGEAALRGTMLMLAALPAEALVEEAARRWRHADLPLWRWKLGPRLGLCGLVVFCVPVIAGLHPLRTVPKRTPAALGLPFEDVRFATSDGVRLAGWLVPCPEARGNVIFCHGHGRNRGHVAGLLPTLHELGLNVLAFDFRGHGDSEGHTSTFGHREVRDLVAAADYIHARYPDRPLFLVGISLGAAVSLQALPRLPEVQGVWSEGCFSRLSNVVENEFAAVPAGMRGPLLALYYRLAWADSGLWGPEISPSAALGGLSVPIYFCHGEEDELVPLSEGEALYQAYNGPKQRFWVPNASHYNLRQRNRDEYLERLRTFLNARLAPSRSTFGEPIMRPGPARSPAPLPPAWPG
jgi:alpha-beta hydrolase superfamily lysophospholipase